MAVASALLPALAGACTRGVWPDRPREDLPRPVSAAWTLLGTTPDERILTVAFQYEGGASGCQRFQDAVFREDPDQVSVSMRLWDTGRRECTGELVGGTVEVVLGRPLGQRALTGCNPVDPATDCRAPRDPEVGQMVSHAVTAGGDAVVAAGRGTALGLDPDGGRVRWEQPVAGADFGLETVGTTVYARADDDIVALDVLTGAQRWRSTALQSATGPPALDAGLVFGATRADRTVVALDAATGALVWSAGDTRGLASEVRAAGGLVVAVAGEAVQPTSGVPWQFRGALLGLDAATGALRWRQPVPERPVMLVAGDPLVVAYEATVAALDPASGATRWGPVAPGPGAVGQVLLAGDALYVTAGGAAVHALDAATGALRWSAGELAPVALALSDDLVLVGGADATVRALDALTGAPRWEKPIGMPVGGLAVGAGLLLAGTWDGVVALDPNTGEVRWSGTIPSTCGPSRSPWHDSRRRPAQSCGSVGRSPRRPRAPRGAGMLAAPVSCQVSALAAAGA